MMTFKDYMLFDKWISKEDMVIGSTYFCKARNFRYGVWNGYSFDYIREKWGASFKDREYHWNDGVPFGTVKPLAVCEAHNKNK